MATQEEINAGRKNTGSIVDRIKALEGATAGTDYSASIAAAYAAAVAAQTAADAAAAQASFAQATANGKNTVTYSTSYPGSTANTAGDIWFVKDSASSSANIIAQYEGKGGTTWESRQLRDEVIANLDAGKLTAGSAFTNTLTVATTLTLGTSSLNGSLQSYGYSTGGNGLYVDKANVIIKGGSLSASVITTPSGSSGATTIDGSGITFSNGGYLSPGFGRVNTGTIYASSYLGGSASFESISVTSTGINNGGGGISNAGTITGATLSSATISGGSFSGTISAGSATISSATLGSPTLNGNSGAGSMNGLWSGSPNFGGTVTFSGHASGSIGTNTARWRSNEIVEFTSSRRFKDQIETLEASYDAIIGMVSRQWISLHPGEEGQRGVGFIAEEMAEAGLADWVTYEPDGITPRGFAYDVWTAAQQIALRRHHDDIADLRARLSALEAA